MVENVHGFHVTYVIFNNLYYQMPNKDGNGLLD